MMPRIKNRKKGRNDESIVMSMFYSKSDCDHVFMYPGLNWCIRYLHDRGKNLCSRFSFFFRLNSYLNFELGRQVAQSVERRTLEAKVPGSKPVLGTWWWGRIPPNQPYPKGAAPAATTLLAEW